MIAEFRGHRPAVQGRYGELVYDEAAFAVRLGTVREVLSRNLSRFQSQGLLRIEQRQVWIEDSEGLRQEASLEMH